MQRRGSVPPGWPREVPPPAVAGWEQRAVAWLLDACPSDYRLYRAWVQHPIALSWVAVRHLDAQVEAMRSAYRAARVELGEALPPEALAQVLLTIEKEGLRLVAARRAAGFLHDALQGKDYVPRL